MLKTSITQLLFVCRISVKYETFEEAFLELETENEKGVFRRHLKNMRHEREEAQFRGGA